jgi:RimJ/RimL family protein N-acetyltransferase
MGGNKKMIVKNKNFEKVPFAWEEGDIDLLTPDYLFYYNGTLCGGFSFNESTRMFHEVCIFPHLWGQGFGTTMMKEAIDFIPGTLYLKTWNSKALHIYRKIGFITEFVNGDTHNMVYERN